MKIEFELRMLLHLCLKKKKFRNYRDVFISLKKKTKSRSYQDVIVFFKKLLVNENWFKKMLAIEFIIVRIMILKQSRKRKTFCRRRKFNILIEFN